MSAQRVRVGRWRRVSQPAPLRAAYPDTVAWQCDLPDGHLSVLVGREPAGDDGGLLWHLSISHRRSKPPFPPGRYPRWDEIRDARYRFVPDEITMAMLLPPKAEYINVHETTFHLWEV